MDLSVPSAQVTLLSDPLLGKNSWKKPGEQEQPQLSPQRGPVPSPYWYWTSLSRNSLSTAYNLSAGCSRPSVSPSIFIRPLPASPAPRRPPLRSERRPRFLFRRRRPRRPETGYGGGAGGAVPRRRVVVRGRLALPSPRPSVSRVNCDCLTGCVTVFRADACTYS